ncbi:MAG: DEAD/DEAH box helicase [Candidatus Cloacimonetes bacterium]|nr:DEAD/DEAH box helicase [Candidatus Cloacimonadota bacterium]
MEENWIKDFLSDEDIRKNIAALEVREKVKGDFTTFPAELDPRLQELLWQQNIRQLYSHQSQAISLALQGKDVALVTGVASGKSLCYQLPVLQSWLDNSKARSLFLFPTKALAQDQKREMTELVSQLAGCINRTCGGVGVYDGDTPQSQRQAIIKRANFIYTNPDMLHLGIMPHHTKWADFFSNLRYVIIDEVHMYRGVFGSQFANVMRRLQRIAAFYGSNIQYICTSATLADTAGFLKKLLERDIEVIDTDGSPQGKKYFAIYNPPLINQELSIRLSSLKVVVSLGAHLQKTGIQSLIFTQTRRMVELIVSYLQRKVEQPDDILGYRSGYLAEQRRAIEKSLKSGEISLVVATNALELGIDIGSLDAIIINGYPGSIASTRQQWGRAGRTGGSSLGILVAGSSLIDQYLVKHPAYLFAGSPEQALINPDNPFILLHQMECALFEKPFRSGESFGSLDAEDTGRYLDLLQKYGKVLKTGEQYLWKSDSYPASAISLRTTGAGEFLLLCRETIIGKVDEASAYWMVHPQAVYLHNGISYLVKDLDLEKKIAYLTEEGLDYYTQSISRTEYELLHLHEEVPEKGCSKSRGEVRVERQVTGFKQIKWGSQEILGQIGLDMPVRDMVTEAYWIAISDETVNTLKEKGYWNNVPNNYGIGWRKLTEKVRLRDDYTCQSCECAESGTAFHVHHKQPFRAYRNQYEANREENLVTLCPACHKLAEQEAYIQSTLAGMSWLLQNLAPLLLMCDWSDIQVNMDGRSSLADGKPAIIMHDSAPGGIGLSARLYDQHRYLMHQAQEIVENCTCTDGCPACTGPAAESGEGAKEKVRELLKLIVSR